MPGIFAVGDHIDMAQMRRCFDIKHLDAFIYVPMNVVAACFERCSAFPWYHLFIGLGYRYLVHSCF